MPQRFPLLILVWFTIHSWSCGQLSDALSVRSLSAERAKDGLPVHLRATVHLVESASTVFVQDATAGTFLRTTQATSMLSEGDIVEVNGRTFPGLFLPGIETENIRVVGHGDLPAAQPANYDDLLSARYHYQRVSVEGIVRSVVSRDEAISVLRLAMGTRVIDVRVTGSATDRESLVDARVRITGLAAGTINDARQMVQPYVRASNWSSVEIVEKGRDAASVPTLTAASVLQFGAESSTGHRVRVQGIVTAVFAGGLVFLRDNESSLAVQLEEPGELTVGDRVSVIGFPMMDRFTPTLADAQLLEAITDVLPDAPLIQSGEWLKRTRDGDLVTIRGIITEQYHSTDGQTLVLSDKAGHHVAATLRSGESMDAKLRSEVEVRGIARVQAVSGNGFNARPTTIALWLRTNNDLRLLNAPPSLTVERLLTALAVLGLMVFVTSFWIVRLRRKVHALELRIRHEAALEERQRIAREFHDTLEQELAGLSLRLDAATTRPMEEKARALLETSRHLVARVQVEARNLVADLRDDPELEMELSSALLDLAHRQPANAPAVRVELDQTTSSLPPHVVHHLRMIAQEAVTNAIKHAEAKAITLRLRSTQTGTELAIIDDGKGFDVTAVHQSSPGHFGCMGIRERCRKINAKVSWSSTPGRGSTVIVQVPGTDSKPQ